jgi:hypothetical protein
MPFAIDIGGSGALQYLRPEIVNPPAIHLIVGNAPPQLIVQSNAVMLAHTLVFSGDIGFEARTNLLQLQSIVRTPSVLVGTRDILAATESLRRLQARENESIEEWADKLGRDLSAHND